MIKNYNFIVDKNQELICYETNYGLFKHKNKKAVKMLEQLKTEQFTKYQTLCEKKSHKNQIKWIKNYQLSNENTILNFENVDKLTQDENIALIINQLLQQTKENILKTKEQQLLKKQQFTKKVKQIKQTLYSVALATILTLTSSNIKTNTNEHNITKKIEKEYTTAINNDIKNEITKTNAKTNKAVSIATKSTININDYSNTNNETNFNSAKTLEYNPTTYISYENNNIVSKNNIIEENTTELNINNFPIEEKEDIIPLDPKPPEFEDINPINEIENNIIIDKNNEIDYTPNWDGPALSTKLGRIKGPSGGEETYYDADCISKAGMNNVVSHMREMGFSEEEYPYEIREDGVRTLGNYVMVAADLSIHPRGSFVETSLGIGIVCDTGDFTNSNPNQLDIATNWTKRKQLTKQI